MGDPIAIVEAANCVAARSQHLVGEDLIGIDPRLTCTPREPTEVGAVPSEPRRSDRELAGHCGGAGCGTEGES
jgi:hypothetical protein